VPFEYAHDPADGVLVVTVSGHPPLAELRWHIDRLVGDPTLPATAPVMVVAHANHTPPPPWEMPGMAGLAARVRERFGGRLAAVTATVGMATTVHLLALLAGHSGLFAAFYCEQAAREWLLERPSDPARRSVSRPTPSPGGR
jgi:hypothetical protein